LPRSEARAHWSRSDSRAVSSLPPGLPMAPFFAIRPGRRVSENWRTNLLQSRQQGRDERPEMTIEWRSQWLPAVRAQPARWSVPADPRGPPSTRRSGPRRCAFHSRDASGLRRPGEYAAAGAPAKPRRAPPRGWTQWSAYKKFRRTIFTGFLSWRRAEVIAERSVCRGDCCVARPFSDGSSN
jgi:hypothetical protein